MIIEKELNQNFDELVKGTIVLVDFYATWCGPCKMMHPILESLVTEVPDLKIVKIDVDQDENLAKQNGIMSVPTLILYRNGVMIDKKSGLKNHDEMIEWLKS